MVNHYIRHTSEHPFHWIDLIEPTQSELAETAREYNLVEQSVQDSVQPDHLPKFERLKHYSFFILRYYDPINDEEADTVQELTNKVAVFVGDEFIISIHKAQWDKLEELNTGVVRGESCRKPEQLFNEIVKQTLQSFDEPVKKLTTAIEYLEENIFLKNEKKPIYQKLYFLKRKVDVVRRIFLLTRDIIDYIDPKDASHPYTRDIRDLFVKEQTLYDSLSENFNHLLNIYFNISAQKTNETIRILTIFSVFFLPLTFIVGIYGMNFKNMPELNWKWGYHASYALMAVVTLIIFLWFKRKKWL